MTQSAAPPRKPVQTRSLVGWGLLALLLLFILIYGVIPSWSSVAPALPNMLVSGVIFGLVIAIIALGYTMVYGVLQLINFAHSEVFATGAITGFVVFNALKTSGLNGYVQLVLALLTAMIVSGLLNVLIERVAYRPLRGATNRLVPLISAIGVSFLLQDLLRLFNNVVYNADRVNYPLPPEFSQPAQALPLQIYVSTVDVVLLVVALIMLFGLNYLVNRTKLGKAIRAVAQDRQTASLMGIDATRMIQLTFLIGGALGGVAGVLWGLKFPTVDGYIGIIPGIKSFTAAVLGGIGSIPGAVLGGISLGVIESYIGIVPSLTGTVLPDSSPLKWLQAVGVEYKDIGAFGVLIIILIFRPSGLLGRATTEKV